MGCGSGSGSESLNIFIISQRGDPKPLGRRGTHRGWDAGSSDLNGLLWHGQWEANIDQHLTRERFCLVCFLLL